jgi:hypothetical protein
MTKTTAIDTDKYFDEYSRTAQTALNWVYPTELRSIFGKVIDLQVETGKLFTKSVTDIVSKLTPSK